MNYLVKKLLIAWLLLSAFASAGFESALTFLDATDNTHLIPAFWDKINTMDKIRNETWHDYIIEVHDIK